jgi:Tol biopolymer transport system component
MPPPRRLAALVAALALLAACQRDDAPPAPPDPCAAAVPGFGWLSYASRRAGNYDIRLVAADGACDRAITSDPADDLSPSFSVSANAVAYAGIRDGKQVILVHDLANGAERVLDTGGLAAVNPAISPNGGMVAFEGRVAGQVPPARPDVYVVLLAGGAPPLAIAPDSAAADAGPAWGDDATLYFVSDRLAAGNFQVFRVKTDGTGLEQLTDYATRADGTGLIVGKAAVSPDGLEIAFARTASPTSRVVVRTLAAGLAAGAERSLAPQDDSEPSFDPRGGALAVTTYEYGDPEVVVRSLANGSVTARLTEDPAVDGAASWAR